MTGGATAFARRGTDARRGAASERSVSVGASIASIAAAFALRAGARRVPSARSGVGSSLASSASIAAALARRDGLDLAECASDLAILAAAPPAAGAAAPYPRARMGTTRRGRAGSVAASGASAREISRTLGGCSILAAQRGVAPGTRRRVGRGV